jgi:ribosomal protein L11 methyltransferase
MSTTIEVRLALGASAELVDRAMGVLSAIGSWALEIEDDPPPVRLFALHPKGLEDAKATAALALARAEVPVESIETRPAATIDWGVAWHEALRSTQIGPLWIVPVGRKPPAGAERAILIDAVVAFGSGTHETTIMCLERIVELSPIESLLDVGTGSGILAIAAIVLGAKRAVGLERDLASLEAAEKNAQRNRVEDRLMLSSAAPDEIGARFPVVVANIIAATLIELAPRLVKTLDSHGQLVLSGVRVDQRDEVAETFRNLGLREVGSATRGHWMRLDLETSW